MMMPLCRDAEEQPRVYFTSSKQPWLTNMLKEAFLIFMKGICNIIVQKKREDKITNKGSYKGKETLWKYRKVAHSQGERVEHERDFTKWKLAQSCTAARHAGITWKRQWTVTIRLFCGRHWPEADGLLHKNSIKITELFTSKTKGLNFNLVIRLIHKW